MCYGLSARQLDDHATDRARSERYDAREQQVEHGGHTG
jgi:hypothetical protein